MAGFSPGPVALEQSLARLVRIEGFALFAVRPDRTVEHSRQGTLVGRWKYPALGLRDNVFA